MKSAEKGSGKRASRTFVIGIVFLLCLRSVMSNAQKVPPPRVPGIGLYVPSEAAGREGIAVLVTLPPRPRPFP